MSEYLKYLEPPAAIAIADKVRRLEATGEQIAKMQTGEPCFDTPVYINEAVKQAINEGQTHYSYSQGIPALRSAIAEHYRQLYGVQISKGDIALANGGVNAIYCAMLALLNKGDEVLIFDPSWPQFANIATIAAAKVNRISTRAAGLKITTGLLEKNITKSTKLVVVNNPCNPSGMVYNHELTNKLLEITEPFGTWLLFDEVYCDNVYTNGFESILSNPAYVRSKNRIIYINSFSKSYAMTGWRIGYAIIPPSLMADYLKVSQNSITNVNTFVQYAGIAAVERRNENLKGFEAMNNLYRSRWLELTNLFKQIGLNVIQPEGAFYFFIPVKKDGKEFAEELLEKYRIAVVPGIGYGADFANYIRISFSVDDYSYVYFLDFLKEKGPAVF